MARGKKGTGKRKYVRKAKVTAAAAKKTDGKPTLNFNTDNYVKAKVGDRTVFCTNNKVSQELAAGEGREDWFKIASKHLDKDRINTLRDKYKNLNDGMVRMNLGNIIRAAIRKANEG